MRAFRCDRCGEFRENVVEGSTLSLEIIPSFTKAPRGDSMVGFKVSVSVEATFKYPRDHDDVRVDVCRGCFDALTFEAATRIAQTIKVKT
jgi:hypothetical protein